MGGSRGLRRSEPAAKNDDSDAPPGRSEASGPVLSESDDELQPRAGRPTPSGFGRHRANIVELHDHRPAGAPSPGTSQPARPAIIPTFNERRIPSGDPPAADAKPMPRRARAGRRRSPDGTGQPSPTSWKADPGRTHVMQRHRQERFGRDVPGRFRLGLSRVFGAGRDGCRRSHA